MSIRRWEASVLKPWTFRRTLGGLCGGRRFCLIALAGLAVVTACAPPEALAQTVDPQSLVGEWEGTWSGVSARDVQGTFRMTVTKVERSQVHGRIEREGWGRQVAPARFDFVGTLEGNKLVFTFPGNSVELTISGT
jgi:hypothetical protein